MNDLEIRAYILIGLGVKLTQILFLDRKVFKDWIRKRRIIRWLMSMFY